MKLDDLSAEVAYVDTNIFYMYLRADPVYLPAIKRFLKQVINGKVEVYVSILVLDELYYRLLLAKIKETTNRNPLTLLRQAQADMIAAHCADIENPLRQLMVLPHIHLIGGSEDDFELMLNNIKRFSLLPRDALHLATMQRLKISDVVSDDRDFDRIDGVTRHWLVNPPLE